MTAHLPVALVEQVDELAERLERSRGWVVKQALAAFVEGGHLT
ncbi:ribbon-helix-helix domain-containing protein [Methyloversatilis discipulorum]|nr:ribbon-helix-helix domain-containing protein [Methyloversatilis discipulorum]